MNQFNVLDRRTKIHNHGLLEASAGTGKTFAIENIFLRLLIEPRLTGEVLTISQILVMTFTKLAVRDLKTRIHLGIEKGLSFLQSKKILEAPDFILAIIEKGESEVKIAKRRLEDALFHFEEAQIFTIHGFCSRMLRQYIPEGDFGLNVQNSETQWLTTELLITIRDFFRTEVRNDLVSPKQLAILLNEYKQQPFLLETALLNMIKKGIPIAASPDYKDLLLQFQSAMTDIKNTLSLKSSALLEDFDAQINHFRNYNKDTKTETREKTYHFINLFEKDHWEADDFDYLIEQDLIWVKAFDISLLKDVTKLKPLNYPTLPIALLKRLDPIVQQARQPTSILAKIASEAQKIVDNYSKQEEKFTFDDYLKLMLKALENPLFADSVRKRYQAAIIDEFQDTDPTQWKIFKILFLNLAENFSLEKNNQKNPPIHLYLVGDPKQSIYAFRQADIYTYLDAVKTLGDNNRFSLDTNYRSQPSLVKALNTLFSSENTPGLISLPKQDSSLSYQKVQASSKISDLNFSDQLQPLHFFLAEVKAHRKNLFPLKEIEEDFFFPFITEEIQRLSLNNNLGYHQFAVLVRDRYQASRLATFLKQYGIPYVIPKYSDLSESPACSALIDLIKAVIDPRNMSSLKTALGGKIIGLTFTEILHLEQENHLEKILIQFYRLRKQLFSKNISIFLQDFWQIHWHNSPLNAMEKLLSQKDGIDLYHDLQQLIELLSEHQNTTQIPPEEIIRFLDQLPTLKINEDDRIKSYPDPTLEGVIIQTIHASKGLEYDIVFALGLINQTKAQETLIPIESNGQLELVPVLDKKSQHYQDYYGECDAEKLRQFYVALTRAKFRVYVPLPIISSIKNPEYGCASPIELFLARFKQLPTNHQNLYERMENFNEKILCQFIDEHGSASSISYNYINKDQFSLKKTDFLNQVSLIQPSPLNFSFPSCSIQSFTGLSKKKAISENDTLSKKLNNDDNSLPSSAKTGVFLHKILEIISFSQTDAIQIQSLIHPPFLEWSRQITTIIINALNTPLIEGEAEFKLSNIPSHQMYKEMEFLFPHDIKHIPPGLIKGTIDLFFIYKNKYYLADWKSNWLGPNKEDYHQENISKVMESNHYFLQADLYSDALKRYLKLVDKRPFEDCFGGIFYLFIRGMNPLQGPQYGVYHFKGT